MIPAGFACNPDGELISMVDWAEEERFHCTLDGQNTVLALTVEGPGADAPYAVYDYSPYGEQTSETIEDSRAGDLNAFGYTGAYQFLDGTVHLSHWFLDTFTMNFTQADPSRQEMNNSTYAEGTDTSVGSPLNTLVGDDRAVASRIRCLPVFRAIRRSSGARIVQGSNTRADLGERRLIAGTFACWGADHPVATMFHQSDVQAGQRPV